MQEIPNTKYQILNTEPKYIPLSEAGKILNTSRDYMNVLVRRKKLRAVKLGRNWVTTREWILDYQKSVGRFPVLKSDIKVSPMSDFGDLAKAEKEEFRNLKSGLILEREKALEAKALTAILLTPEIKLTSRELHVEERKNILELVSNRFKKVDASEFEKASRRFGILKSLRQRSGLKFGVASGLIAVLFIVSFGFTIGIIPGLNISGFFKSEFRSPTSGDLEVGLQMQSDFTASLFSDVFKNFPNDIPLFSRWFTLSLSKGFAFLKLKTPSELVLSELPGGESKIIKPQEALPRVDTFDEALALDAFGPGEEASRIAEGEILGVPVSVSEFTLIENRLSVVEANLKEQNALTQTELSLQKKTILGTLETLIGISKLLPTYPISTIVVQGQPATLTTYSVQPQVNTGFDRLSADYFTLAHDAIINGHLTVRSGGEFNTLSVSGATTLTGNTTIGGTLNVAGDSTLANVTVNGIFTAPNVSLTNASTTYLTVSNTAWIKEIFATQNLSVATTSASNALTVQGNTFLYGGLGVGMATTTSGAIQTSGDVFVGRNLYVSGNSTTIGQSSSDTLVVNSSVGSNLVPTLNNWYNLGSPSFYWGDAYIDTLNVNNISAASTTIGGTESATFTINTDNESIDQENMNLVFFRGTVPPNAVISWNAATSSKRFEFNQAARFFNESASTTNPVLTVQGNTGLTANAFQVLDVTTTTVLFSVNPVSQKTTMTNASTTNLTVSGNLWAGSNGAFMLADGTVSNPALAFAADTDTGLFRIGDGKMSFTTNATTSLTLDTGKVIVGNDISTASYQLEVADRDTNSNTVVDELRLAHYTTGTAGNGLGTGLLFYGQDAEGAGQNLARIAAVVEQATSSATFKSGLAFSTVGSGGLLEKMRIDNAGNVGIGTTSPAGVLSIAKADSSGVTDFLVNPTVKTSGNLLDLEVGGSSLFRVASNGAVFGTGSIQITYGSVFKDSLSGNLFMPSDGFGSMFIANNAGGGNGNIQFQTLVGSLLTRMVIAAQGQVGIGSELSPANALTVNGALSVGNSSYNVTAPTNGAIIQGNVGIGTTTPSNLLSLAATTTPSIGFSVRSNTLETGFWTMGVDTADANKFKIASSTVVGTNTRLTIDGNGNVGIGTTSPWGKLSVLATDNDTIPQFIIASSTATSLIVTNEGNVGIGVVATSTKLHVEGASSGSRLSLLRLSNTGGGVGTAPSLGFSYSQDSGDAAYIAATYLSDGPSLQFATDASGGINPTIKAVINGNGNFGIGTSSASTALDIWGGNSSDQIRLNTAGGATNPKYKIGRNSTTGYLDFTGLETGFIGYTFSNGNVGIASTSPSAVLSVNVSNATGVANALNITSATSSLLYVRSDGNVGIGATNPDNGLTLGDKASDETGISQNLSFRVSNSSQSSIIWKAADYPKASAKIDTIGTGSWVTKGLAFYTSPWWDTTTSVVERVRITEVGNVGIGTSTPLAQLSVQMNPSGVGYFTPSNLFVLASSTTSGVITTHFLVTGTGNVGIGTTSPVSLLSVNGNTRINGSLTVGTSTLLLSSNYIENTSSGGTLTLRTNSADRLVIDNSGNVGIGTTSPNHQLTLSGNQTATIGLYSTNAQAGERNWAIATDILISGDFSLMQSTAKDGNPVSAGTSRLYIAGPGANLGNVGIGTTTPGQKLSVTGNIVASGCISAYSAGGTTNGTCADIAESYFSGDDLTPADIIAAKSDPTSPEGFSVVRATSTSAIIGVVSTRPAIYMQGDSALFGGSSFSASSTFSIGFSAPLALAGRVPVKVSLENGPIAIGDRISASSVAGVGKKAKDGEATVGMALEAYDGTTPSSTSDVGGTLTSDVIPGVGKILVFVNLGQPQLAAANGTGDLASMVTANSDLNMNGFSILNVKSIAGMNGLWRIDEGGNITAQSVQTQSLTVGGGAASGVTIYDRTTSAPKCIYIEGGVIKTSDGACGTTTNAGTEAVIETASDNTQLPNQNPEQITNNQETITNATTTPTMDTMATATTTEPILTATTTLATEPVVATSTESVIIPETSTTTTQ